MTSHYSPLVYGKRCSQTNTMNNPRNCWNRSILRDFLNPIFFRDALYFFVHESLITMLCFLITSTNENEVCMGWRQNCLPKRNLIIFASKHTVPLTSPAPPIVLSLSPDWCWVQLSRDKLYTLKAKRQNIYTVSGWIGKHYS